MFGLLKTDKHLTRLTKKKERMHKYKNIRSEED